MITCPIVSVPALCTDELTKSNFTKFVIKHQSSINDYPHRELIDSLLTVPEGILERCFTKVTWMDSSHRIVNDAVAWIMSAETGIPFQSTAESDCNGNDGIYYDGEKYAWLMTPSEKTLTPEKLQNIFSAYANELCISFSMFAFAVEI